MLTYVEQVEKIKVPFACINEVHLIWNKLNIITVASLIVSLLSCSMSIALVLLLICIQKKDKNT